MSPPGDDDMGVGISCGKYDRRRHACGVPCCVPVVSIIYRCLAVVVVAALCSFICFRLFPLSRHQTVRRDCDDTVRIKICFRKRLRYL